MDGPVLISVVIPAYNEELNIVECLACLQRQTLPATEFEVILVDNGSTDRTIALAEDFCSSLSLRIHRLPRGSISAVRNEGASLAAGSVLAFLDADCMPKPSWLASGLELMDENAIWGAHYLIPEDSTWVGRIWFKYQAMEQSGDVSFLPAGCLLIARQSFIALGGFDPAVKTSEDVELCARARARAHGMRVIAYPELAVYHEGTPQRLPRFYRQNRWHGQHVLRVFITNLPSTRNLPLVALTIYTFLMFWLSLITPFLVPRRDLIFSLVPLGLLLLPAMLLAVVKTVKARSLQDMPGVFVLYLTYFLARAAALLRSFSS